ncbi:MAG: hypothetical protein WC875_03105 [Candidatus Absconditabacterales bacterium]|jgi:predicted type IV restriction endonuclease
MKIENIHDVERLLSLISLPTITVNNEKMATDNICSLFINESSVWKKRIIPHVCHKVSLTYIAKSIDGYNTGENNEKELEKQVFTYGMTNIKKDVSLLVCIETKDYKEEKLEKAFPVLLENIISFEIIQNCMKYTEKIV